MKTIYKKLLFLLLLLPTLSVAQSSLTGVVTDSKTNQPLPGVNVVVQDLNQSSVTDFDGKFSLSQLKSGNKIVFTFIGYKTQTITYSSQKNLNVSLEEQANELQEVVVQVGYGTVKKKDATGSVTTLTTKDFNKGSIVTAENLLSGRVAGVTVNTSGAPGSGSEIRIRGGASLFASNDPLIILDGLPLENRTATGGTSLLSSINPSTIASITVLKDASATAIYGSRASNGVILITTKKGGKELSVEYNFQLGSGKNYNQVDVLNAKDFVRAVETYYPTQTNNLGVDDPNSALSDDPATPGIIEGRILYDTDWQKEIYRTTTFVNNDLTLKGQLFKAIPSRLTLGNTSQEGSRLTNKFVRNSASLALNPSLFKNYLKIAVNANFSNEVNRFTNGVEGSALSFDPTKPVYNASNTKWGGYFENVDSSNNLVLGPRNPISELLQRYDRGSVDRIFGNAQIDYKLHFLPDLRLVVNVGLDHTEGVRRKNVGTNAATAPSNGNFVYGEDRYENSQSNVKLFDGYLAYNKTFGKINIDATAGYSYQKFSSKQLNSGNVANPFDNSRDVNSDTDLVLLGYFARTNFSINDKYLLTLSYRRDGSSRFPKDEKFGNFPAASFAWKLDKEFFKESKLISDLKLRVGYGVTGQQDLPVSARDFYLPVYQTGGPNSQYYFGGQTFIVGLPKPTNPLLKWEETTTYNAGLDYGFLKNRISGTLDFFYKESNDLLANVAFADGANFANAGFQNIGSFTTKGVELNINYEAVKNQNFNWNVNLNATKFERRIKDLAYGTDILVGGIGGGTGGNIQILSQGYTPFSYYVYKQLYDSNNDPIEGAYADLNGDGSADRYIYKNPDPDVVLGFQSSMNYKNIDFSFNLRASVGNRVYNNVNSSRAQLSKINENNPVLANVPSSTLQSQFVTTADVILSDYYIENASFLRMDNITLGYTIPKWLEGKASLRFSAGVQNPFILTNYSGLDPEITGGIDNTIYPRQRQILFGANVKF